jgi:hypothetical protein
MTRLPSKIPLRCSWTRLDSRDLSPELPIERRIYSQGKNNIINIEIQTVKKKRNHESSSSLLDLKGEISSERVYESPFHSILEVGEVVALSL